MMFKKIFLIAIAAFMLAGCNNNKDQEKALLNEVIKYHDKLMDDDGIIVNSRKQLKIFAATTPPPSPGVKDSLVMYGKQLDTADDAMMAWMNKFNPDFTGKTHDEIMAYLTTQKVQITKIDSQLSSAISASDKYILKLKGQ